MRAAKLWLSFLVCLILVSYASARTARRVVHPATVPVSGPPSQRLATLAETFLHESLQLSPVSASQAGYHTYVDKATGKTVRLDADLDDLGTTDTADLTQFYRRWQRRLRSEVPYRSLNPQDKADWVLMNDGISTNLLELEKIQSFKHNPTFWVELIGNALFLPLTTDYAPKEQRMADAVSRVSQIARLLGQARQQLVDSDPIFIKVAVEENAGNVALIDRIGNELPPSGDVRRRFALFSPAARKALLNFSYWLENELGNRPTARSWRLGKDWYDEKFRLTMQSDVKPEQLLADAESDMQAVREEMLQIALPLHQTMFPEHADHSDLSGRARENKIIGEVLDRIGQEHPNRDQLMDYIQGDLAEITRFIREKKIVGLSSRENLNVVATPEFMRGVYSVAGFHAPPPLDPNTGAEYWVTPIDPKTPEDKAESRLREYNNYTLHWLTIHEALPGHYIQFEHANDLQPPIRRLLRAYFANGPYVEGWAEYIASVMMDEGFLADNPKFRLVMRKIRLRLLANTILDIRMHTMGMTDAEAMELMTEQAFQTQAEAQGKLQRAKLTSVQLPTYYVGLRGWQELRSNYQKAKAGGFDLMDFHNRALGLGPIPLPLAQEILVGIPAKLTVDQTVPRAKAPVRHRRRRR